MKNTHLQVFSKNHQHIGHFDGEYFYPQGVLPYRIDDDEIYTTEIPTEFIGYIEDGKGTSLSGETLFFLSK